MSDMSQLELQMYTLIQANLATMTELKETYTLDEALTLYSLHKMSVDVERCRNEDLEAERERRKK